METTGSSSGCGDGLLASIFGGGTKLFHGTVLCPEGKMAVGGGAECMPGAGRPANIFTLIGGSPKGLMVASRPTAKGQGWYVECCLKTGGILSIGGKFPAPQAYAVCIQGK